MTAIPPKPLNDAQTWGSLGETALGVNPCVVRVHNLPFWYNGEALAPFN